MAWWDKANMRRKLSSVTRCSGIDATVLAIFCKLSLVTRKLSLVTRKLSLVIR